MNRIKPLNLQRLFQRILLIAALGFLILTQPAQAEHWTLVVSSEDGYQRQYVDTDSMERQNGYVRLKTYWLDTHQPDAVTYAVTEYDCDRQLYRDIELNGNLHQTDWFDLGEDQLNRAVMSYSCPKLTSLKLK